MTTLRLILGDQLNSQHSWFTQHDPQVHYILMEVRQETDYVLHHAQKVLGIFAAMRMFAENLKQAGHHVHYLAIDAANNTQDIPKNLDLISRQIGASRIQYQAPDEWRLDKQLQDWGKQADVTVEMVDTEHFLTERHTARAIFKGRKRWLMEQFYRTLRQQYGVLMHDSQPIGDKWNFDADNRKAWKGKPPSPADSRPRHNHSALWQTIVAAGIKTFGNPQADAFSWPLTRDEALTQLTYFVDYVLPNFGDYQDAMHTNEPYLFHSLLSFALNTKMISPKEVVDAAQQAYLSGNAPLAAVEGFIRQILGWREYVRGVYWSQMPGYTEQNELGHNNPLPDWFWTGRTQMQCLSESIGQSLEYAYAHHIQRLMVVGNFALLAGIDPQALHRWYLGIYIDAFEWVEAPNTLGMSQFADGGLLATKPYVSSAAYIGRMSNYCKGCRYDPKKRTGENACPFNALYWNFYERHAPSFEKNPRIGMAYRQLAKMTPDERAAIYEQALFWQDNLNHL
ncbi:cryptochrome/photolyase family protein [Orrella daihaiensis]|uniref:Cryptochrome/photolyase family protein n=1 Tax=Orrella daihaiensis TaxID=2782176 RepID=A0ABY4AJQ4_9BURK|nr:cryptochrome/photolyase family protein [Orrella daihaiensis]UOD49625.1 cryptochrome/photolyase family protein [Orrella daihaiensis]